MCWFFNTKMWPFFHVIKYSELLFLSSFQFREMTRFHFLVGRTLAVAIRPEISLEFSRASGSSVSTITMTTKEEGEEEKNGKDFLPISVEDCRENRMKGKHNLIGIRYHKKTLWIDFIGINLKKYQEIMLFVMEQGIMLTLSIYKMI